MGGQDTTFDTLYLRSNKQILIPVYDTVKQLERANAKADSISYDLQLIKCKLGLTDKPKKNERY